MNAIQWQAVVDAVNRNARPQAINSYHHGSRHWHDVARTGLALYGEGQECDLDVVLAFALLHDSQRRNEGRDPEHGQRAADLAGQLNETGALDLDGAQIGLLTDALIRHDTGATSDDPTIGTCWDSDRLTLWRVGVEPDPAYLSTEVARTDGLAERVRDRILASHDVGWPKIVDAYANGTPLDLLAQRDRRCSVCGGSLAGRRTNAVVCGAAECRRERARQRRRAYFHGGIGGLKPGDLILPPSVTGLPLTTPTETCTRPADVDCVYVAPTLWFSLIFATMYEHKRGPIGAVYRVRPEGLRPQTHHGEWEADRAVVLEQVRGSMTQDEGWAFARFYDICELRAKTRGEAIDDITILAVLEQAERRDDGYWKVGEWQVSRSERRNILLCDELFAAVWTYCVGSIRQQFATVADELSEDDRRELEQAIAAYDEPPEPRRAVAVERRAG